MKKTNQIGLTGALALSLFGCFFMTAGISAQSLKVNINVNSTVGMQQMMPFEIIPENEFGNTKEGLSAQHSVNAIGAFTITGKENTDILVRMDAPEVLVNKEKQTMPFSMNMAWQTSSGSDVHKLNWLNNKNNVFKLSKGPGVVQEKNMKDDDLQAYLYLKSTAEVPSNAESPFEGEIHLTIEY
ncbi:MAG: hypothetical protein NT040_09425 [Bacteroidetes bacterium]|nr:hypothetical protein [Bacteroidota bacterium]